MDAKFIMNKSNKEDAGLDIPVLERELEVVDTKSNSITLRWQGLDADQVSFFYLFEFFISIIVKLLLYNFKILNYLCLN